jgi:hypothetical protein
MDGWMDRWIDGWMDGWIDGYPYVRPMSSYVRRAALLSSARLVCRGDDDLRPVRAVAVDARRVPAKGARMYIYIYIYIYIYAASTARHKTAALTVRHG